MIGGKVLDASALAALARRRHSALVWFDIALTLGLPSMCRAWHSPKSALCAPMRRRC